MEITEEDRKLELAAKEAEKRKEEEADSSDE
jgi:hypothetical protein